MRLFSIALVAWLFAAGSASAEPAHHFTDKDGAPMRLVPAGEFTMGSNEVEDEQPIHQVHLDAFYLDQFETTAGRYATFLKETQLAPPRHWDEVRLPQDDDRPVIGVTWFMAENYCHWAGKRLPTEAEWEKAARGSDGRTYPWGNEEPTAEHGNFGKRRWAGYDTLAPVGSFKAGLSPYGIADLAGNVWEWVADWYAADYYQTSPSKNPTGPAHGEAKSLRGGGWNYEGLLARSADRNRDDPTAGISSYGFRCAKDAK